MRKSFLYSGILILLFAWAGPLPTLAPERFYAHMIMHMLVVAVAAPLLSLAISNTKFDLSTNHPILFAPIPAAVAELIIVWGWHAPVPHHFARHHTVGLFAEQSMFILAGIWVWLSCFSSERRGAGIIGFLLTSMHMTLLGALLGLAPRSLYNHHSQNLSMSSLEDQQLGGAIMLVVGGISYLVGGLYLTAKMIQEKHHEFKESV